MSLDGDIISIYSEELITLSEETRAPVSLPHPDLAAKAISPICGSEVSVELQIQNGKIAAFGFAIESCALTRATVTVMTHAIIGKTRAEIARAGADMQAMLEGDTDTKPSGDWQKLCILEPVRDYPSRHNALLLPFEAVEKAFRMQEPI